MNPNEAILKPGWHHAPKFSAAWTAIQRAASDPIARQVPEAMLDLAHDMSRARVLKVAWDDLRPVDRAIATSNVPYRPAIDHLPFDPVFLEVAPSRDGGMKSHAGVLVDTMGLPELRAVTFVTTPDPRVVVLGPCSVQRTLPNGRLASENSVLTRAGAHLFKNYPELYDEVTSTTWALIRATLYLLQSANVDLREPELNRQGRRAAERSGDKIPLELVVRRPKSYSKPRGGSLTYSHAHDRAGNFAHHFEMTRDGRSSIWWERWEREAPERAIVIDGHRCYRVWRPPTVVGVGDGPYVPKVRVMSA